MYEKHCIGIVEKRERNTRRKIIVLKYNNQLANTLKVNYSLRLNVFRDTKNKIDMVSNSVG